MTVDEAFAPTDVETLDMVVGQNGFAQFDGEKWVGTLETMSPGMGYMYQSASAKKVIYNTSIVSNAAARYATGIAGNGPLVVDIHRYPSAMPVVATLATIEGTPLDNGDYNVSAFCGTECRGIGKLVNGLVMMNIYGKTGDHITFRVTDSDGEAEFATAAALDFSERSEGNLFDPYVIGVNTRTSLGIADYEGSIKVILSEGRLTVKGINPGEVELIELYDLNGYKLLHETVMPKEGIDVSHLVNGVYVVIVQGNGEYTYHKVALR